MPVKPIYIVKLGSTLPELRRHRRDFEDWILAGLGGPAAHHTVVNVIGGNPLPRPNDVGGVVITGSHATITDREPWSERTAAWLPEIVKRNRPVLGICYGHQLLAHALGGKADDNPAGREFGTVEVSLADDAADDPLFGVLPNPTRFHVSHNQAVVALPPGARLLASSERDPHQAFAVGSWAWGVQFHPEFDVEITRAYIAAYRQPLLAQGDDPDHLIATCVETPDGPTLLRQFADLVERRNRL
jgi:GMP synthase (glutamine-hydrolysing)